MCNSYLMEKITNIGFKQSVIEEWFFYQGCAIFSCYMGNFFFEIPCKQEIYQAINDVQEEGFDIEDKVDL